MKLIRNFPLRLNILSIFILLLVSTVSIILYYSYTRNTASFLRQSRTAISSISRSCIEKTQDYLSPAAKLASLASNILSQDVVPLEDWEKIEHLAFDMIKEYPQLAMFNFGDEQGNFLMIKKMPDKTLATKIVDRRKKIPVVTWKYRDRDGKVIKIESSTKVEYDPRVRPWYRSAVEQKKLCWSNLYFFFTDKKPGISASFPVVNRHGGIVGALGFDITLSELSEFLRTVNISSNAETLVVNACGEVVAYMDAERAFVERNGQLKPAKINELGIDWLEHSYLLHQKNNQNKFNFEYKGKPFLASYMNFPKSMGKNWKLIVVVPESDFTATLDNTNRITMLISCLILVGGIILVALFSNLISRPMTLLTRETVKVKDFDLSHQLEINSHIAEIQDMAGAIKAMKSGLRAFQKYVPSSLVRELINTGNDAVPGGESRDITLFFSDIEGFTTLSEKLSPQALMLHLSEYLTSITAHIQANRGTVDKFIGDSVMAFWGAPQNIENHPELACRAAIGCRKIVEKLNETWIKENKAPLHTRIGLHSGKAVVGNLGSADRMNYTAIGDGVNLASRLEGVNKIYGTTIIVSEETCLRAADFFIFRELDLVAVKGRKNGVRIFELIDEIDAELTPSETEFITMFECGIKLYRERKWHDASKLFSELQKLSPDDLSLALYLERCRDFITFPPPADWNGIYQIDVK